MTTELNMLVLAAFLALIQILIVLGPALGQLGLAYLASPRDEARGLTGVGARAQRAFLNMMETLPIFAIAVLVTHVAGATNGITAACAQIYVIARVIYVPVYLMGIPWLRTAIWLVATLSIVILLLQAVL